jgi:polysaccharide deacetylase 2 family uncharacterized protein YibQ
MCARSRSAARLAVGAALALLLARAGADELAGALPPLGTVPAALPAAAASTAGFAHVPLTAQPPSSPAPPAVAPAPKLAVIIDDLGYRLADGLRAARLPGAVAVAILPRTPHAAVLAQEADTNGKEIVLHVPMQALESREPLGPGALELAQSRAELSSTLAADLAAVPLARLVSNHMGSSLTRASEPMRWIMEELKARGTLAFVDSYTTADSVALAVARDVGVPALRRDVFLDGDPDPAAIEREWRRFLARARERGTALAIGHPRDATLTFLERALPEAAANGFEIVTLGDLLTAQHEHEEAR